MLQKELAKRLKGRYETEVDNKGWFILVCLKSFTIYDIIKEKWATIILYQMKDGPKGLSELEHEIKGITQNMLLKQLRELAQFELVEKKSFKGYPLRVEYSITEGRGRKMLEAISIMQMIGIGYMVEKGMAAALIEKGILTQEEVKSFMKGGTA